MKHFQIADLITEKQTFIMYLLEFRYFHYIFIYDLNALIYEFLC